MTIYLACTVRGDRAAVQALRTLCDRLDADGHTILTRHLLDDDVDAAEDVLGEQAVYERDIGLLERSDLLIADASGSSYGVGFEVGYVLGRADRTGQRVLLLYDASRQASISRLIVGNCDPACTTFGYRSIEEIPAFLERHLTTASR